MDHVPGIYEKRTGTKDQGRQAQSSATKDTGHASRFGLRRLKLEKYAIIKSRQFSPIADGFIYARIAL